MSRRRRVSDRQLAKWWSAFAAAWSSIGLVMHERRLATLRRNRPWCATCLAYGPALRPRPVGSVVLLFCERCDEHEPRTTCSHPPRSSRTKRAARWQRVTYCPFDETERDLSFRILRTVARFDWITTTEMRELMGVAGLENATENNTFAKRINVLTKDGFLRRRWESEFAEYQITLLGRVRIDSWRSAAIEDKRSIAA